MQRPASIIMFERCYLAAWLIGLIRTAVGWNAMVATANANPSAAALGPSFAETVMIVSVVIGAVISLLLWYFVARRGSVVAKWIVVVFFAIGLLASVRNLFVTELNMGVLVAFSIVALVLQAVAVTMLFRPDAKPWFGDAAAGPAA